MIKKNLDDDVYQAKFLYTVKGDKKEKRCKSVTLMDLCFNVEEASDM